MKGKMSRMLAAKSALAIRVDALGEETNAELGLEHRAKLEKRLRYLEEGGARRISGSGKFQAKWDKFENKSEVKTYNPAADSTLPKANKKRKFEQENGEVEAETSAKIPKVEPKEESSPEKKKKKKNKYKDLDKSVESVEVKQEPTDTPESSEKKKKKKKKKTKEESD